MPGVPESPERPSWHVPALSPMAPTGSGFPLADSFSGAKMGSGPRAPDIRWMEKELQWVGVNRGSRLRSRSDSSLP